MRDLLLSQPLVDLDLAFEGEAATVAQAVARRTAGRAVLHGRVGTASVSGRGFHLDVAQTRTERYTRPGALPSVEPATIGEDLLRRDFSINALALRLTPPAGEIIDPTGGLADLEAGMVSALHQRSFQDDATRMLRAARYATRLGFKLDALTERWLRRDLRYLDAVGGARLRRELSLLFSEKQPAAGTLLTARLGVLAAVHPTLGLDGATALRWQAAVEGTRHAPLDELGFCVVSRLGSAEALVALSERLHLTGRLERALRDLLSLQQESAKLVASPVAEAVEALDRRAAAAVWALSILGEGRAAGLCREFLTRWRRVRPALTGDDLLALGVPQGAAVGEALRRLRRERIEGRIESRAAEVAFVRRLAGAGGRG